MVFNIALKDLKVVFRDKKALLIMLLMPALIMLILGTALGSAFTSDAGIDKFPIAVVNKDGGTMSDALINMFLRDRELSKTLDTFDVNENTADNMLKNKIVPSVIIIPEDFSKNINSLKNVKLEVKSNVDQKIKSNIVESIVNGYANSVSMSYKSADTIIKTFGNSIPLPSPANGMSQLNMLVNDLQDKLKSDIVNFKDFDQEKAKSVSALQYYSAAMLVMFLLISVMSAISNMIEERDNKTLMRIMATRASRVKLITGKCTGLLLIGAVQSSILIIFTRFAYKVDWGGSLLGIGMITICTVFACSGLGMLVAGIARTLKAANGLGSTLVQVLTALGGGMVPVYVLPGFLKTMSNATPNWQAMDGYYKLMQGLGPSSILSNCLILAVMGTAFISIGIFKFRTV